MGQISTITFVNRNTGFSAAEPTMGVLADGAFVYKAFGLTIKSPDEGVTWAVVHNAGGTNDPYIHVDKASNRIIGSDLFFPTHQRIHISDNGGAAWQETQQLGTIDHQKIGSGPWHFPVPPLTFPSLVYTCVNRVADTACAVSPDGGVNWGPLVTVFVGDDPTGFPNGIIVPTLCGGLEGDPVSAPDGTIYVPREYCGRPFVGVSTTNGLAWTIHQVAPPAQTRPIAFGANNPAVAAAQDGNVFYAWTGDDWRHYAARSNDQGSTWTSAMLVSPTDVLSTTFPLIWAGDAGKVATAYLGTRDTAAGPDNAPANAKWHLFATFTLNGNDANPTWETIQVTPETDPVQIGCIGRHGPVCGNGNLLDFNDIELTNDGRVAISYTDGCLTGCTTAGQSTSSRGFVAVQTGGPTID